MTQIGDGYAFGELALENNEPRSATITAIVPTHLAVLDKEDYLVIKRTVVCFKFSMLEKSIKTNVFWRIC